MFIQHCFIRKNTPELCQRLRMLGYHQNFFDDNSGEWLAVNHGMFISVSEGFQNLPFDDIDCGDNENLFLALAALRNDTDKNQWIIDQANECFGFEDSWMVCDRDDMNDRCVYTHYRKASAKEIIERFKN